MMQRSFGRRAFTLIETGATIGTLAVLTGVLLPSLGNARRAAQLAADSNNLRQLHAAAQNYAADFQSAVPTYSWRAGVRNPGQTGPIVPGTNDVAAAAAQATEIIRRSGRDIAQPGNWIPHIDFSHLVLLEYMGESLLSPLSASPGDRLRLSWQADPTAAIAQLRTFIPSRADLLPYSSSYQIPPTFYAPDRETFNNYIRQSSTFSQYFAVGRLGDQRFDQVLHPSRKVYLHDTVERFFGRAPSPMWWRWSRINSIMVDGSVRILQGRNSLQRLPGSTTNRRNPGAYWGASGSFVAAGVNYSGWDPRLDQPPVPDTPDGNIVTNGIWRWTAGGKQGIDVDEVSPFATQVTVPENH
ncbi:MAG: type II secretion system GspH family protein [Planctomycetaceae bacterium]|jgi:type II secretory pathway pseudopilin PulG|nr:type II secretion system protein [Phycisphaerales bacterium]MCE2653224.1 type II secretion system GspH family protein [Planctomycetaceae bacterium]